jgi:hypothetical protein
MGREFAFDPLQTITSCPVDKFLAAIGDEEKALSGA